MLARLLVLEEPAVSRWSRAVARFGVLMLAGVALSGCSRTECDSYRELVEDSERHAKIVAWADSAIFSREFQREELFSGRMAGPGNVAVRMDAAGLPKPDSEALSTNIPQSVLSVEVRLIGSDRSNPVGIFIGQSSYRGVIIGRSSLDDVLVPARVEPHAVEARRGRVGLVCVGSD